MNSLGHQMLESVFWVSLGMIVYTYFLYPLALQVIVSLRGWCQDVALDFSPGDDDSLSQVTMVISAYNEEVMLPDKIKNCQEIDYPADKISFVIGSDGLNDASWKILAGVTDNRFRMFHSRIRRSKVQMVNYLMKQVSGDISVFSDANTMYRPDAVRQLVQRFDREEVGAVIGKLDQMALADDASVCRTESLYWRYGNWLKEMESRLGAVSSINGGIFAIRRDLYEEIPSQAITKDQVLGMNIMVRGYRCLVADQARATESVSSFGGELRRQIRISAGNFQSVFLVPGILNPLRGWVNFAFVSHKLIRGLVPFYLLAVLLSNIFLAGSWPYGSALMLQTMFYASGLLGALFPVGWKILAIPKYFLARNVAILIGFGRFLGRRHVTWTKAFGR